MTGVSQKRDKNLSKVCVCVVKFLLQFRETLKCIVYTLFSLAKSVVC